MATSMTCLESLDAELGSMDPFGSTDRVALGEIDSNLDIFSPVVVTPTQRRRAVLENEASSMYRARQSSRSSNGSISSGFRSASSSSEERTPNGKKSSSVFNRYPYPYSKFDSGNGDSQPSSGRSSASPSHGQRASPSPYALPSPGLSPFSFNLWGKVPPNNSQPPPPTAESSTWNDTVWQSAYLKASTAFQMPMPMPSASPLPQRSSGRRQTDHLQSASEMSRPLTPPKNDKGPLSQQAMPGMLDTLPPPMPTMQRSKVRLTEGRSKKDGSEMYSRKVFIGGLPPDIEDHEIRRSFLFSGPLTVDWPHKSETNDLSPPKGYAFLVYSTATSVEILMSNCHLEDGSYYFPVSSQSQQNKKVQIRPWRLSDSDFYFDTNAKIDPRRTVFVGGVPRPLRAVDLAGSIDDKFGNVCYAGIDTDNENDYPKGAGRVTFSSGTSYIAAINTRFIQINFGNVLKRVELKPYVLDDMMCDSCGGARCCNQPAPYFCGHVTCLTYLCSVCWSEVHAATNPTMALHRPLVKEGDRRLQASSWGSF